MYVKSSVMLVWCIKKKTKPRTMAKKLLDVLRDLISDGLLRYKMMCSELGGSVACFPGVAIPSTLLDIK